ncbi:unnamed protein product [Rotaria magnacalcarata]
MSPRPKVPILLFISFNNIYAQLWNNCLRLSYGNSITGDEPCYRVTLANGTKLCASPAECDSFDTCREHKSCPSVKSVCH